jgi:hypothetical protein
VLLLDFDFDFPQWVLLLLLLLWLLITSPGFWLYNSQSYQTARSSSSGRQGWEDSCTVVLASASSSTHSSWCTKHCGISISSSCMRFQVPFWCQ